MNIREQYNRLTESSGLESDFKAMLDWLEHWKMKPCASPYFADEVNAILVTRWILFRESLRNRLERYDREYLEQCAIEHCEPDDLYELQDCLGETSDGHLMAIGRLFYE